MTTLKDQIQTARKKHFCDFCNAEIQKGEKYRSVTFVDGKIFTCKYHLCCEKAIIKFTDPWDEEYSVDEVMEGVNDELTALGYKIPKTIYETILKWNVCH